MLRELTFDFVTIHSTMVHTHHLHILALILFSTTRPTDISVIKRLESVLDIASYARINVDLIYRNVHNHSDSVAHVLIEIIIALIN